MINAPVAAGFSITLGIISLGSRPKGFWSFLNVAGIGLGFLSLAAFIPLLLIFLAYI